MGTALNTIYTHLNTELKEFKGLTYHFIIIIHHYYHHYLSIIILPF